MEMAGAIAVAVVTLGVMVWAAWGMIRDYQQRQERLVITAARQLFRLRREWLEAAFVSLASERNKPRDLVWADCEFANAVSFARDRDSGQLRALVGVTISFEPRESSGLDSVEAVCALRAATAVFSCQDGVWHTDGRAVFNLSPQETIRRYHHELEVLE